MSDRGGTDQRGESLRDRCRRLEAAVRQLEHEREGLAELYDFAPFAYLTLDPVGVIHNVNWAALQLLGDAAPARIVGRRLQYFVVEPDRAVIYNHLRRCRRGSETVGSEVRLLRHGKPPLPVRLASRMAIPGARVYPTAMLDLRERQEAAVENQRLVDAERQAQATSRAKDDFIAMLSHELRTPLAPVLAAVSALNRRGDLPQALRPVHDMIQRNLVDEVRLIDDLLDATRIVRGKLRLELGITDLHLAAEEVIETLASEVAGKNHRLTLALDAQRHHVAGDPIRLRQVLWNLLRNAIKFSPPGGHIALHSWNSGHLIAFEVSDEGVGFPSELAPRLFSPFEQGTEAGSGGLGLGLAICRGLVELHGGEIRAVSAGVGRGARFVVQLATVAAPAAVVTSPSAALAAAALPAVSLAGVNKPRILLVEDHPDTAELLNELFAAEGFEIQTRGSIRDALAADLDHVDVMVSDIGLPDGSGLELMKTLRVRGHIRGIALSGYGSEADVRASKEAGYSAHLTKPVDWPHLLRAIAEVVARSPE